MNRGVLAVADRVQLDSILDHMGTLSDPLRCRTLLVLERHELTVSELCSVLQLPQSTVSRHLKTLADARWVTSRRDGTSRFYTAAIDELDAPAQRLWPLIREQVSATAGALQDQQRLGGVLARRRSKSQEFFASSATRWDQLREELFGARFELQALLALVDEQLVIGDLGCGTGRLSEIVAPVVKRVIAVDGSSDMVAQARQRLHGRDNVDVRSGTLEALPIASEELDVALLGLVLHHVPDPAAALAECARVLKRGPRPGRVLVIDMLPHDHSEYQQQMGHVWLGFAEPQMRKLLGGAGFRNIRVQSLPIEADAKGPTLFVATATRQ